MLVEVLTQIVVEEPTFAAGNGLTVILTESDFEQPVAVIVSVSL